MYITGASRGIGLEISRQFYAAGAKVLMMARDPNVLDTASREFSDKNRVETFIADLTHRGSTFEIWDWARKHGQVNILVNCAGIVTPFGSEKQITTSDAKYKATSRVNFIAPRNLVTRFIPEMIRSNYPGRIINLNSGIINHNIDGLFAYTDTKRALHQWTNACASRLARLGSPIILTSLLPGVANTGMQSLLREAPVGELPEETRKIFEGIKNNVITASSSRMLHMLLCGIASDFGAARASVSVEVDDEKVLNIVARDFRELKTTQ